MFSEYYSSGRYQKSIQDIQNMILLPETKYNFIVMAWKFCRVFLFTDIDE